MDREILLRAAREFVELIEAPDRDKTCTVIDGIAALKVVDACRESSSSGRRIEF